MANLSLEQRQLCDIQGRLFELALKNGYDCPMFIQAFMNSRTAAALDVCPEGLVLHLAREVAPEDFAAFMARCGLSFEDAGRKYSAAERMRSNSGSGRARLSVCTPAGVYRFLQPM